LYFDRPFKQNFQSNQHCIELNMCTREGTTKAEALSIWPIGCQTAGIIDIPAVPVGSWLHMSTASVLDNEMND
jgi:hypothetical protein